MNTNLISKIVHEACELSNEELDILIDRLRELYDCELLNFLRTFHTLFLTSLLISLTSLLI